LGSVAKFGESFVCSDAVGDHQDALDLFDYRTLYDDAPAGVSYLRLLNLAGFRPVAYPVVAAQLSHAHFSVTAGVIQNCGAPEGIRTPNLLIRSQMLYPLSYGRWSM
jgi:hypothetical protein